MRKSIYITLAILLSVLCLLAYYFAFMFVPKQSDQVVPPNWFSVQTVDNAIIALPENIYTSKPSTSLLHPLLGKEQEFNPQNDNYPTILVSTLDVPFSTRYDFFWNGPRRAPFISDYLDYYGKIVVEKYLIYHSSDSLISNNYDGNLELKVFINAGAFKSTLMIIEGKLVNKKSGRTFIHHHYIFERYGKPYIISQIIEESHYDKDMFQKIGFSLFP